MCDGTKSVNTLNINESVNTLNESINTLVALWISVSAPLDTAAGRVDDELTTARTRPPTFGGNTVNDHHEPLPAWKFFDRLPYEADKVYENRLRRAAMRQGFLLRRNRTRDQEDEQYRMYVLIEDCAGNRGLRPQAAVSAFQRGEGWTLEGVGAALDSIASATVELLLDGAR